MAEGLVRKKRIHAGHKATATRMLTKVNELLSTLEPGPTTKTLKLTQLKLSLQEKLETLRQPDSEILDLSNAEVPYSTKHPILLPKDHQLTTLVVLRAHKRVSHGGVRETLTEL